MNHSRFGKTYKRYIFLFILFSVLFLVIPYCDDDLRWGSAVGAERVARWFDGYGGRYFGYFLILLLTRVYSAKVLVQALVMTHLVYMMNLLSYSRRTEFITVIFLFFMPLGIFSDTVGWTSGFANYMISAALTLIYVRYVYRRLDGEDIICAFPALLGYFLLGMLGAMIVEHFSFYNLCLALFIILYTAVNERRIRAVELVYFSGVTTGILLMFSNSAYRNILAGEDFYRRIVISHTVRFVLVRINQMLNICYIKMPVIVISLTAVIYLIWREYSRCLSGRVRQIARLGTGLICCLNPIILLMDMTSAYDTMIRNTVSQLLAVFVLTCLALTIGIFSYYGGRFWHCMGTFISIGIPLIPFLILSPLSCRCYVGSYIFWILLLYQLLALIPETRDKILMGRQVQTYLGILACAAVLFYTYTYADIQRQDIQRRAYIRNEVAQGATTVVVHHLKDEQFTHDITLDGDREWNDYKDFYGIDPDIKILVEPEN